MRYGDIREQPSDHGVVVSGCEQWGGVRPLVNVFPGFLRPVNEREADPWLLLFVPAHGLVELGDGSGVLPLDQSHAVSEARNRA